MALKSRYSPLAKPNFENIYNAFIALPQREQLIATAVAVLLVVLIIILPLSMVSGKIGDLKKGISRSQGKYQQVFDKVGEYRQLQGEIDALEKRFGRGMSSMITVIESLTRKTGVQGTIEVLKEKPVVPGDQFTEIPVELKLKNVTLKKTLELLYQIETFPQAILRVRSLQIKPRFSNRVFLDVSLDIASITLSEGA